MKIFSIIIFLLFSVNELTLTDGDVTAKNLYLETADDLTRFRAWMKHFNHTLYTNFTKSVNEQW